MRVLAACFSAWTVILGLAVAGCGGQDHAAGREAVDSAPVASAAGPAPATGVPAPVEQAEALAEDVQTDLEQDAWPAAEAKLRTLRSLAAGLESIAVAKSKQSAYRGAIDSLGAAITSRSRARSLTAGNRVSRIVTGIMADYPTKVPVEVSYMDVAGRDALYAAQQGSWSGAADAGAELGRSYAAVQAGVRARNPALDQSVTLQIAQLQHAVSARATGRAISLAQAILEDVDRIEQTF